MKTALIISKLFIAFILMNIYTEALAVRPPLRPLNVEEFRKMISESDVIAVGTINRVSSSKKLEPPIEIVTIRAAMTPEKILKGDASVANISIEETYRHYSTDHTGNDGSNDQSTAASITARIAGPAPAVGTYREGARLLVLLKSLAGKNLYQPLGSGNHDAYLGVFHISSEGVKSDKYKFDEILSIYGKTELEFVRFITSLIEK